MPINGHDRESTTLIAIGERDRKVVFQFPHPVRECVLDAETARQAAEQIASSAYAAHYGRPPPAGRSAVTEHLRRRLKARAVLVVRSLMEQGKHPDYIASHVTDLLLKEVA